jgi:hypothetical protein
MSFSGGNIPYSSIEYCTKKKTHEMAWLLSGVWKLRGIRKKIDKGCCPLYLDKDDVKHLLLSRPETRKWRRKFVLLWLLPTQCRCRRLLLHLITLHSTHTLVRTPLGEESARRRALYLHNTQHSQETNMHAPGWIRTGIPSKREAANLRLRLRGHRDLREGNF